MAPNMHDLRANPAAMPPAAWHLFKLDSPCHDRRNLAIRILRLIVPHRTHSGQLGVVSPKRSDLGQPSIPRRTVRLSAVESRRHRILRAGRWSESMAFGSPRSPTRIEWL